MPASTTTKRQSKKSQTVDREAQNAEITFTISQSQLQEHLIQLCRIVPKNPTHLVLANLLIEANADEGTIALTAFDLAIGLQKTLCCQVSSGGKFTVPAKLLADLVSRLPEGDLTIEVDRSCCITVKASGSSYKLVGLDAEEYPELSIPKGESLKITTTVLRKGLKYVRESISKDQTRQILTGGMFAIGKSSLSIIATDGHKLSLYEYVENNTSDAVNITVPSKVLEQLQLLLTKDEAVLLQTEASQAADKRSSAIAFKSLDTSWVLTGRLLQGQYPDCRQLISVDFLYRVIVDKKQIVSALERASLFIDSKQQNSVRLSFFHQEQSAQIFTLGSNTSSEWLPIEIEFCQHAQTCEEEKPQAVTQLDVAFNLQYLQQVIQATPTAKVQLCINSAISPVLVRPVFLPESEQENQFVRETYEAIVMPLHIQ